MIRAVVVLCLSAGLCLKGHGQVDAQLQVVDSHFAGVWVGTNHSYTKSAMVSTPVKIEIRDNPKKRELRLEYTYGTKGQKGYDHLVRFLAIKPAESRVDLHWQHDLVEHYQATGLDGVLNTGYGEIACAGKFYAPEKDVLYRFVFHIEADRFTYSWEKSDDGVKFVKTGDWDLMRE